MTVAARTSPTADGKLDTAAANEQHNAHSAKPFHEISARADAATPTAGAVQSSEQGCAGDLLPRRCAGCDAPLIRREGEPHYKFKRRLTCGHHCRGIADSRAAAIAAGPDPVRDCGYCGTRLVCRSNEQRRMFRRRRFCGNACAASFTRTGGLTAIDRAIPDQLPVEIEPAPASSIIADIEAALYAAAGRYDSPGRTDPRAIRDPGSPGRQSDLVPNHPVSRDARRFASAI